MITNMKTKNKSPTQIYCACRKDDKVKCEGESKNEK